DGKSRPVPPRELAEAIPQRRRACLHRLVGQITLHIHREAVGRLVAAGVGGLLPPPHSTPTRPPPPHAPPPPQAAAGQPPRGGARGWSPPAPGCGGACSAGAAPPRG